MSVRSPSWWQARTLREQRLLLVMFAAVALLLAWLLIVRPLGDAYSNARERHGRAVIALGEAKARAETIRALERGPPAALREPLQALLGRSANEAGFALSQLRSDSNSRATVAMAAVRPQAFFGWVSEMERADGLIVERLTASTNADQSLAVEVSFRTRGS